jgi:hypothetical protein
VDVGGATVSLPRASLTKTPPPTTDTSGVSREATQLAEFAAALFPISTLPFQTIGTIGDLLADGLPPDAWLNQRGVYAVILPLGYEFQPLDPDAVHAARNVIAPWPGDRLRNSWLPNTRVAYIGFAGHQHSVSLRKRLRDLLRHAAGEATDHGPHRRREHLWQIAGYEDFTVMVLATDGPPAPRETEQALLDRFRKRYGARPFGNRSSAEPAAAPPPAVDLRTAFSADSSPTVPPQARSTVHAALEAATAAVHADVVREAWRLAQADMTLADLMDMVTKHGVGAAFLARTLGELRGDPVPPPDEAAKLLPPNS